MKTTLDPKTVVGLKHLQDALSESPATSSYQLSIEANGFWLTNLMTGDVYAVRENLLATLCHHLNEDTMDKLLQRLMKQPKVTNPVSYLDHLHNEPLPTSENVPIWKMR